MKNSLNTFLDLAHVRTNLIQINLCQVLIRLVTTFVQDLRTNQHANSMFNKSLELRTEEFQALELMILPRLNFRLKVGTFTLGFKARKVANLEIVPDQILQTDAKVIIYLFSPWSWKLQNAKLIWLLYEQKCITGS